MAPRRLKGLLGLILVLIGLVLFLLCMPIPGGPKIVTPSTKKDAAGRRRSKTVARSAPLARSDTATLQARTKADIEQRRRKTLDITDDYDDDEVGEKDEKVEESLEELLQKAGISFDPGDPEEAQAFLTKDMNIFFGQADPLITERFKGMILMAAFKEGAGDQFGAVIRHGRTVPLTGPTLTWMLQRRPGFLKRFAFAIRDFPDADLSRLEPVMFELLSSPGGLHLVKLFYVRFKGLRSAILARLVEEDLFKPFAMTRQFEGKLDGLLADLATASNSADGKWKRAKLEDLAMIGSWPACYQALKDDGAFRKAFNNGYDLSSHEAFVKSTVPLMKGHSIALHFLVRSRATLGRLWLGFLQSLPASCRIRKDQKMYQTVILDQLADLKKDEFIGLIRDRFESETSHPDDTLTLVILGHENRKYFDWYLKAFPTAFDLWDVMNRPHRLASMKPNCRRYLRAALKADSGSHNPFSDVSRMMEAGPSQETVRMYFALRPRDVYALSEPVYFQPTFLYGLLYLVSHHDEVYGWSMDRQKFNGNPIAIQLMPILDDVKTAGKDWYRLGRILFDRVTKRDNSHDSHDVDGGMLADLRFVLGSFFDLDWAQYRLLLGQSMNCGDHDTILNILTCISNKWTTSRRARDPKVDALRKWYPPRLWAEDDLEALLSLSTDARARPTYSLQVGKHDGKQLDLKLEGLIKSSINSGYDDLALYIMANFPLDYAQVWRSADTGLHQLFPAFDQAIPAPWQPPPSDQALITQKSKQYACAKAKNLKEGSAAEIMCRRIVPALGRTKPFAFYDLMEAFLAAEAAENAEL